MLPDRIEAKINRAGPLPRWAPFLGPCWLWTAATRKGGYGAVGFEGRVLGAHVVVYRLLVGPIPDDLELDHLCRVTACVRPSHLEAVTHAENLARAPRSGIITNRAKTTCPEGHPYRDRPHSGGRVCDPCLREHQREATRRYRQRQRELSEAS